MDLNYGTSNFRVYLAQEKHITEFEPLQDFAATISRVYVIAHINLVD